MRALEDLRKFAMVRRPLSEPKRVSVSCSLETGVTNSLQSSAKRGQRWRTCSWTASGLGGHITAFTVPVLVGDVELVVVICVETMHGAQLGESPEDFGRSFELAEHFAGFGVGRSSGAVPECCSEGQGLVGSPPTPKDNFCGFFFVVREACLDDPISSAPLFGFSEFVNFYSLVAWNPGYVYVGIVVSL